MKQTKKLIAILCVCLSALAVGCGSSAPAENAATDTATEAPADTATTDEAAPADAATTDEAAPADAATTNTTN